MAHETAPETRIRPLRESDVDPDPIVQFAAWFEEARAAGVPAPEAMALATSAPDGFPSVRMVLLKGVDAEGFVFFTSYESRKGRELSENDRAALLFHWHALGRQLRVEGTARRVTREESGEYFRTRPLGSRLAASVSPQSAVVPDREELERLFEDARLRFASGEVPLPPTWGGYRLAPHAVELWQHRDDRLHDRLRYRRVGGSWLLERLAP